MLLSYPFSLWLLCKELIEFYPLKNFQFSAACGVVNFDAMSVAILACRAIGQLYFVLLVSRRVHLFFLIVFNKVITGRTGLWGGIIVITANQINF